VKVGEENLPAMLQAVLHRLQLFHLHDHLGFPHRLVAMHDARTCGLVVLIGEANTRSGLGLHDHLVLALDQCVRAGRGEADPVLVVLDLLGDTDSHELSRWYAMVRMEGNECRADPSRSPRRCKRRS